MPNKYMFFSFPTVLSNAGNGIIMSFFKHIRSISNYYATKNKLNRGLIFSMESSGILEINLII